MTDSNNSKQRRKPPTKSSATFPPQFARLFDHVLNTQKPLTINNLGNERKYYTSFRARLSEFRRAFYDEAMISGEKLHQERAEAYYMLTFEDPKYVDNQWQCSIKIKSQVFADAIDGLLKDLEEDGGMGTKGGSTNPGPSTIMISDLLPDDD